MHCLVIYYFILCWTENWHLALCSTDSLNKSESQPEPLCETPRKSRQSSLMVKLTIAFIFFCLQVMPKRTNMPGISTTDRGGHRGGHSRGRGRGYRPPRYQNSSRGRFRYQATRPQHQTPHPYYGGPSVGKRQWGHMEYHEQPKRYPCLLLITPPSEELGAGASGQHYAQQR